MSSSIGFALFGMLLLGFAAYRVAGVSRAESGPDEVAPVDPVPQSVTDPVTGVKLSGTGIVMISRDGCSWCDKFEREEKPKFESVGYHVETTKKIKTDKYPKFRIWDGSTWTDRVGFFTLEQFKGTAEKAPELAPERDEAKPESEPAKVPEPKADAKPAATVAVVKEKTRSVDPVSGFVVHGPTVIILSTDGCAPCITWDRTKGSFLRSKDVDVFAIKTVRKPSYPSFRIFDGKRWHDRTGPQTTAEEVLALIGSH